MKKKTGIDLSDSRFRELLKRKQYRYRRPKRDLGHLQDKVAKADAEERLEGLKKGHRRRFLVILYGRNDLEPGSAFAGLLDEARATKTHSDDPSRSLAGSVYFWRI